MIVGRIRMDIWTSDLTGYRGKLITKHQAPAEVAEICPDIEAVILFFNVFPLFELASFFFQGGGGDVNYFGDNILQGDTD